MRKGNIALPLFVILMVCVAATTWAAVVLPPSSMPRANAQAVWANGKVHWAGGTALTTYIDGMGKEYNYFHTSGYSIYNPTNNTWTSSKWNDPTSPKGIELHVDENGAGDGKVVVDDGTYYGTSQAFAYDYDHDGVDEIFIHAGYPSFVAPVGGFYRFDPNNGAKWDRVGCTGVVDGRATTQYCGVAALNGSKVYCVGGLSWGAKIDDAGNTSGNGFSIYDFATNTWSVQADAPFTMTLGVGAFVNNKLYVIGGKQSTDNGATTQCTPIWCYDPNATSSNKWTKVADLLKGVCRAAVSVYNNKIYVMGGFVETTENGNVVETDQKDIQVFDPAAVTNKVTKLGNLPVAMSRCGGVISPAGMLFAGGGRQVDAVTGVRSVTNLWWKADLTKTLAFTSIAADPAYFPYQDWDEGGIDFTGKVVDPNGNPIPGAIVAVKKGTHATADAPFYFTADANGEFKGFIKSGGPWYAAAWKEGFTPSDDYNVTPVNGEPVAQDITISKAAGVNIAGEYSELYSFSSDQSTNGNVVDNNLGSIWESDPASGPGADTSESFYIEFPGGASDEAITDINGVTIYWNDRAPAAYTVSTSDQPAINDENWTDVYTVTDATGGYSESKWETILADPIKFDTATVRTLRITVTKLKSDKDTFAIRDIKIHSASRFLAPIVTGIVKDEAGNPIASALVHFGPNTPEDPWHHNSYRQILTGADGTFSFDFPELGSGEFDLTADAFGYKNVDQKVTLSTDGSFVSPVEFVLPAKTETSIVPNWNCEELDGNGAPVGYSPYWEGEDGNASEGTTVTAVDGSIKMTHTVLSGSPWFDGGVITDYIPVKDDGTVAYNVWYSTKYVSGDTGLCYYIKWYGEDKSFTGDSFWYPNNSNNVDGNGWWRTNAQDVAYRLMPPAGAKYMRIIISRWGGGNAEILYDNVIVEKVSLTDGPCGVTGTVKDESGNPVAGALVHLGPSTPTDPWHNDNYRQVLTDADGNYSIDWTGDGTFPITADAFGYANSDKAVTISGGEPNGPVNFVLKTKAETNLVPNWNCETLKNGVPAGFETYYEKQDNLADRRTAVSAFNGSCKVTDTVLGKDNSFDGGMLTDFIPVKDDGTVGYNFWYSTKYVSGDASLVYYFRWYAEDKSFLESGIWARNNSNNVDENGWWKLNAQDIAYRAVPPAGAKYLRVVISRYGYDAAEMLYDNFVVEEAPVGGSVEPPVVTPCENIADIKNLEDGTPVTIAGKQMTAVPGSGKLADTGYIEETNRSSGIKLDFANFLATPGNGVTCGVGAVVSVEGTVTTINGEKAVDVTAFTPAGGYDDYAKPVAALGMNNRFANAPLATGLYVKLWGKVLDVQSDNFTITDGSETPVVVYSGDLAKPGIDDVVRVKGILSKDVDGTTCLIMNPEQVEWVDASAATQPLPIQSYIGRTLKPLMDWQVLGPFQKDKVDTAAGLMGVDFISEATGGAKTQANIRPTLGMTVGNYTWTRYYNHNNGALVDLLDAFKCDAYAKVVGYMHTYVWSPVSQDVDLCVGTDELMDVWVNGVKAGNLANSGFGTPAIGGNDYQGVHLNPGYNSILVKVANTVPGFGAAIEIIEKNTYPVPSHPWPGTPEQFVPVEGLGYSFAQ